MTTLVGTAAMASGGKTVTVGDYVITGVLGKGSFATVRDFKQSHLQ